ncbi:hypothetical protein KIN20_003712 [Parelaphostrongylus tenuis]|uniref:Uncharacterized protein n=1 Tax=Parelaphostrongylus tenuis TaxID=148309 RepID=A0AAD5QIS8_PARTN|nr:hypothetical protein KIN20_003712 [Parelaphostrongylus tenuis]
MEQFLRWGVRVAERDQLINNIINIMMNDMHTCWVTAGYSQSKIIRLTMKEVSDIVLEQMWLSCGIPSRALIVELEKPMEWSRRSDPASYTQLGWVLRAVKIRAKRKLHRARQMARLHHSRLLSRRTEEERKLFYRSSAYQQRREILISGITLCRPNSIMALHFLNVHFPCEKVCIRAYQEALVSLGIRVHTGMIVRRVMT